MKKFAAIAGFVLSVLTIFAQPAINSFTPLQGDAGTTVTIIGTGFSTDPAANTVYFGAVKAVVTAATATSLSITAPVGATYQPICVTINTLSACSAIPFNETFAGDSGPFNANSFLVKKDFTPGIYPHGVSLADFNGDGLADVLVSRGSSFQVSIYTNASTNGNITLSSKQDIAATGDNHEGAATADFDGDGKTDFVITNSNGYHSVSVFRNTSAAGAISFAGKIDFAATNSPYAVAAGDLDADGKPDIAIANNGGNVINVYRNTSTPGNISFAAKVDFPAGTNPYGIAITDLTGDGKPELLFTTQGSSSSLFAMKNTSAAATVSFDAPINAASLSGAFVVTTGDLDGDGKPDIAAASAAGTIVAIRNISSGSNLVLAAPQIFATGSYPVCVSITDMNGDGKPDMVTANRFGNSVSVLKNKSTAGSLSFEANIDYAVGDAPLYIATGDLDGDGRPDIISANSSAATVSVLRNISGANIAPVITSFTPASGVNGTVITIKGSGFTGTTSVKFGNTAAASFTVDSSTGISATAGTGASGSISVTTPNGTATMPGFIYTGPIITSFSPAIAVAGTSITITGENFTGATAVKFGGTAAASFIVNNANSITAITGAGSSGSVTVTTANGTAALAGFSFGAPVISSFTPAAAPVGATVTINGSNFDATAANNIVFFGAVKASVTAGSTNQLSVTVPAGATYQPLSVTSGGLTGFSSKLFTTTFVTGNTGLSAGSFVIAGNYGTGIYPFAVTICDMDDDKKADILLANSNSNNISILKNASTPGNISISTKTDFAAGTDPKRIVTGDLDGDGKPDVVVSNANAGLASSISVFRNTSTPGTVSMDAKKDYASGDGSIGLAIADMDADGRPDILVASGNSGFISFFKNTTTAPGIISFAPKTDITLFSHGDNIIATDLDNDGKPDLISANFGDASIAVFKNVSSGGIFSLSSPVFYTAGTHPSYISAADINGDGKTDILVSNYTSKNISLFRNNSNPGFISLASKEDYNLSVSNIALADLNGDGKIDLCNGLGITGRITIAGNTSSGTGAFSFMPPVDFATGNYDTYTASADLDGDGRPELVAANTTLNNVSILRNKLNEPVIDSISFQSAVKSTVVTISGQNLAGATAVNFGGTAASSFTVLSSSKIDAVVGAGASGDITVTTPSGNAVIPGFKFIPEIAAGGTTAFCKGASVVLTSTAAAGNQWFRDGTAVSGATGNTYQATNGGVYSVKTTSNGITTTSAGNITVSVTTVTPPLITPGPNHSLVSSVTTGNQWYLDGVLIPGAAGQTYIPAKSGNYSVKDTADGCISDFSAAYPFLLTGIIELGNNQYIKWYPNPVRTSVLINWNINAVYQLHITVTNMEGRIVVPEKTILNNTAVNLSALPPGFYFLKIYSNNQLKINQTVKMIKLD